MSPYFLETQTKIVIDKKKMLDIFFLQNNMRVGEGGGDVAETRLAMKPILFLDVLHILQFNT